MLLRHITMFNVKSDLQMSLAMVLVKTSEMLAFMSSQTFNKTLL